MKKIGQHSKHNELRPKDSHDKLWVYNFSNSATLWQNKARNEEALLYLRKLEQFIPEKHFGLDRRLCIEDLITADFTEITRRTAHTAYNKL